MHTRCDIPVTGPFKRLIGISPHKSSSFCGQRARFSSVRLTGAAISIQINCGLTNIRPAARNLAFRYSRPSASLRISSSSALEQMCPSHLRLGPLPQFFIQPVTRKEKPPFSLCLLYTSVSILLLLIIRENTMVTRLIGMMVHKY